MAVTLTLPSDMATRLQDKAKAQHISADELALDILASALEEEADDALTLEEVVALIRATPPDPTSIHSATSSLLEYLSRQQPDPSFDEDLWNREWATAEAHIEAIDRADDMAEGRR